MTSFDADLSDDGVAAGADGCVTGVMLVVEPLLQPANNAPVAASRAILGSLMDCLSENGARGRRAGMEFIVVIFRVWD